MDDFDRATLEADGFRGFVPFGQLDASPVPDSGGVYAVLRESNAPPVFLDASRGGHFKKKDPTVARSVLEARWVDGCPVIYIGKAKSLRCRLRKYRSFGQGKPVSHWGGRYIWQVEGSERYVVAWRVTIGDPRAEEIAMLASFRQRYGCRPFANIIS